MLEPDTSLFLLPAGEPSEHVLRPAMVVRSVDGRSTLELTEPAALFEEGMDVTLYREIGRTYMRQAARVLAVHPGGRRLSIETRGKPFTAENRDAYRVCTITADLRARLAGEEDCWVLDASATGLSLLARTPHEVGALLEVDLHYQGADHGGIVLVQSARPGEPHGIRYGLSCRDDGRRRASLATALPAICLTIQRRFLQRLSGNR